MITYFFRNACCFTPPWVATGWLQYRMRDWACYSGGAVGLGRSALRYLRQRAGRRGRPRGLAPKAKEGEQGGYRNRTGKFEVTHGLSLSDNLSEESGGNMPMQRHQYGFVAQALPRA